MRLVKAMFSCECSMNYYYYYYYYYYYNWKSFQQSMGPHIHIIKPAKLFSEILAFESVNLRPQQQTYATNSKTRLVPQKIGVPRIWYKMLESPSVNIPVS